MQSRCRTPHLQVITIVAMTRLEVLLKTKSHIIWDWNGTLLDDVDLCVFSISQLLRKYSLPEIDRNRYLQCFSFPVANYYQSLGFDFEKNPFGLIADEWVGVYQSNFHLAKLHRGAEALLNKLKKSKFSQSVLSAAKETHLLEQLQRFQIRHLFDHVFGISDHYAKGKIERGHELIGLLNGNKSEMILIGDTDHDKEVADALGIDLLLLGDGHQHPNRLQKFNVPVISISRS